MAAGGVYQIRNVLTGDRYIGRSIDFERRCRDHRTRLRLGGYKLPYLQNAWNKYGGAAFVFEPLIECSAREAVIIEQLWLDHGTGEYNVSRSATTPVGAGDKLSPETVAKIANAQRGKPKPPRPDLAERNRSLEHRAKVSAATIGVPRLYMRGRVLSPETRAKMAKALEKGRAAQAADPTYAARNAVGIAKAREALDAKQKPRVAARLRQIIDLRAKGLTQRSIAALLGTSQARVSKTLVAAQKA